MRDPFADDPQRNCYGIPAELFFSDDTTGSDTRTAKRVCRTCPMVAPCRQWAVETFQEGVWGGTTDDERVRIRAEMAGLKRNWRNTPVRRRKVNQFTDAGMGAAEIAERLGVSARTVQRHRAAAKVAA